MKSGWESKTLGEVSALITRGISPKYSEDEGVCVLNQKCIRGHRINYELARRHNNLVKPVKDERFIKVGDVLINSTGTGTLGRVAQVRETPPEATTVDSHVTIVRPIQNKFYMDYFGYLLIGIEEKLKAAGEGACGQTELAKSAIANEFLVTYPISIEAQKEITEKLDIAFAEIENAVESAKQNLANSKSLFLSILSQTFSKNAESWGKKCLSEVAELSSGGTPTVGNGAYWNGNIPWYSSGELNQLYTLTSERLITQEGLQNSNAKLFPKGSLMIGMYDTAAMKMSILEREGTFNQAIAGIKPNDKINMEFIYYALNYVKPYVLTLRRGVRQRNLSLSKIKDIVIGIPEIKIQTKVAESLNEASKQVFELNEIYTRKLSLYAELKASLLKSAFSGELTKV